MTSKEENTLRELCVRFNLNETQTNELTQFVESVSERGFESGQENVWESLD